MGINGAEEGVGVHAEYIGIVGLGQPRQLVAVAPPNRLANLFPFRSGQHPIQHVALELPAPTRPKLGHGPCPGGILPCEALLLLEIQGIEVVDDDTDHEAEAFGQPLSIAIEDLEGGAQVSGLEQIIEPCPEGFEFFEIRGPEMAPRGIHDSEIGVEDSAGDLIVQRDGLVVSLGELVQDLRPDGQLLAVRRQIRQHRLGRALSPRRDCQQPECDCRDTLPAFQARSPVIHSCSFSPVDANKAGNTRGSPIGALPYRQRYYPISLVQTPPVHQVERASVSSTNPGVS